MHLWYTSSPCFTGYKQKTSDLIFTFSWLALALSARVLGIGNRVSSPSQVIHLQYKAQTENIKISNKTHHFEYGPTRRSFSDQEHLTDRAVATFWTTTKPRRKEVPRCTMGKPVSRRRFEKKTYHKQMFYYCANVLRYCVSLIYILHSA